MRTQTIVIILATTTVAASLALAEKASDGTPYDIMGAVHGSVRQYPTRKRVRFREVRLSRPDKPIGEQLYKKTKTDGEGSFSLTQIPAGRYRICVNDHQNQTKWIASPMCEEIVTTSTQTMVLRDFWFYPTGTISGRFFWEDGKHIVIARTGLLSQIFYGLCGLVPDLCAEFLVNYYRTKKPSDSPLARSLEYLPGGMYGWVEKVTPFWEVSMSGTYLDRYELLKLKSQQPATLKAVLHQSVGDYYVIINQKKENIPVRAWETTADVNFAFPKFKDPDDRVSVTGKLIYPRKFPSYVGKEILGTRDAVVRISSEDPFFVTAYHSRTSTGSYRLHGVPPGRYKIEARFTTKFEYRGEITVPNKQPAKLDLILEEAYEQKRAGAPPTLKRKFSDQK